MSLFDFLRRTQPRSSAQTAKDRLQIILAHERQDRSQPEYLPLLQKDILDVIRKYVEVANDKVHMQLQREERISTLEIEIELPGPRGRTTHAANAAPSAALAR